MSEAPRKWVPWARFGLLFAGVQFTVNAVIEAREDPSWSWWSTLFFCLAALCLNLYVTTKTAL